MAVRIGRGEWKVSLWSNGLAVGVASFLALGGMQPVSGQGTSGAAQPALSATAEARLSPSGSVSSCLGQELLRQISVAGDAVEVSDGQPGKTVADGGQRGAAAASTWSREELANAFRAFEVGARKGEAAAEVNLAIATLAGWDQRNGAGAETTSHPGGGAALYWLSEAAQQGYALAYFDLGILYQTGCGVRQDYAEAAHYFELGAKAGHAASQLNLGYLYDQGRGVERDLTEAAAWYRKAAEAGLAQAQFNLADLYVRGEGVARNEADALEWFQKAARQGHTSAQMMLAAMYAQGRGTTKDLPTAYAWLTVAAQRGDVRAQKERDRLGAQLNPAQIALAQAAAAELAEANKRAAETAALH